MAQVFITWQNLKKIAKNVLQDNYESLSYCHTMQQQLNNYCKQDYDTSKIAFEDILKKQENNVTEPAKEAGYNTA